MREEYLRGVLREIVLFVGPLRWGFKGKLSHSNGTSRDFTVNSHRFATSGSAERRSLRGRSFLPFRHHHHHGVRALDWRRQEHRRSSNHNVPSWSVSLPLRFFVLSSRPRVSPTLRHSCLFWVISLSSPCGFDRWLRAHNSIKTLIFLRRYTTNSHQSSRVCRRAERVCLKSHLAVLAARLRPFIHPLCKVNYINLACCY